MNYQIQSWEDYLAQYEKSKEDPEKFWNDIAEQFVWHKKWDKTLEWNFEEPDVKWFVNGKLNITENLLDRHLSSRGDKPALIWEPNEPNDPAKTYTYRELYQEVCKFANLLKSYNIKKGDRVCMYMPMVPELLISTLACARIGAIHSIVFAGFSAKALADRINDADCKMVITSDMMARGAKKGAVKEVVDQALENCPSVETVLVKRNVPPHNVSMQDGRDVWMDDVIEKQQDTCEPEVMDAEDTLFILYTSGSTGKPKGVVHSCGGYMVYTDYSFRNVFQYQENEVYWCTADIGWITGHSYIIYGPLSTGATTMMFEGVPSYPDYGRFWQIVDKHKVNIFYTAPTAIRALMAKGDHHVTQHDLSSLRVIGTVGEPINEEAWHWYHDKVGKGRCPVADTWWQTETGGIMISPLAGITPERPSYATYPLPGVFPALLTNDGKEIEHPHEEANLTIKYPWPSILRTTWGDHERCRKTYFDTFKGYYFTGDGALRDEEDRIRVVGRVDDVINVSGHRFGTAEIENAIDQHPSIVESAVVGFPHDVKGKGIYAYVIPINNDADHDNLRNEIIETVAKHIGKIAKPDKIQFVSGLPKTRSGKIMRRILRKVAEGDPTNLGDTTTLLDPSVVDEIINGKIG